MRITVFRPLLLSGRNKSPRSISTCSQRRLRISRRRQPVKRSRRSAAAAIGAIFVKRTAFGTCLAGRPGFVHRPRDARGLCLSYPAAPPFVAGHCYGPEVNLVDLRLELAADCPKIAAGKDQSMRAASTIIAPPSEPQCHRSTKAPRAAASARSTRKSRPRVPMRTPPGRSPARRAPRGALSRPRRAQHLRER